MVNGKDLTPPEQIAFLKHQAPGAKYVLSVCGGSLSLATAGLLEGKRATTNKSYFRAIEVRAGVLLLLYHCIELSSWLR